MTVADEVMGRHLVLSPERQRDGGVEMGAAASSERTEGHEAAGAGEQTVAGEQQPC